MEQIASLNEQIEHANVHLLIRPFALTEEGGATYPRIIRRGRSEIIRDNTQGNYTE